MIDISTYIDISDAISLSGMASSGIDNSIFSMFNEIPILKSNLSVISFLPGSIDGKKESDTYLIKLYNNLIPLKNYVDSDIVTLRKLVNNLQVHVTAHYLGGVNKFLSDNGEKVMHEFADLSKDVGYIIDPGNIL